MRQAAFALGVLEALPQHVMVVDGAEQLAYANPAFLRDLGLTADTCPVGAPLSQLVRLLAYRGFYGPGDPESLVKAVLALDRGRETRRQVTFADGSRSFELVSVPLPGGGFVSIGHDVTAMRRAREEQALRARLLEATLAGLRGGVVRFDAEMRIGLFNPAYEALIGLAGGTLRQGMTHREVLGLLVERGEYPDPAEAGLVVARLEDDRQRAATRERRRPSGTVLRFESQPTADGGSLLEVTDITALRHAEAEASRRAALIDAVLEALPHGISVYGPDQRLSLFNRAYARIMEGAPIAIGDHLDEVVARRVAAGEYDAAYGAESRARRVQGPMEVVRRRPNGTVVAIRTAPMPDGGHVSVVTDVTALHEAERAARERAEMLDAVLEALPDGVSVYGPDGRARAVNAAYRRIMGDAGVRIGESHDELADRHVAAGEMTRETVDTLLALHFGPEATGGEPQQRLRPDGTAIVTRVRRMPDGGHIAVTTDVTALHRAEAELRRRAAMQEAMLSTIRHGIILYGPDRRLLATNAKTAEVTGAPRDALRPGRTMDELLDEQVARGEMTPAQAARMKGYDRSTSLRYSRERADGRVLDTVSEPTPDGGFVVTYSDVTEDRRIRAELERARAQAEAASEAKSRFIAAMSHELRTPLSAVIGFSEAIGQEGDRARVADYAAMINEAGRHLLQLVDDLLDVARSQTGALSTGDDPVSPAAAVEAAIATAMPTARAAGLELALQLPAGLPWLRSDAFRLRQILDKLLSNAVKFTPAGGRIAVSAEAGEAGLAIRIADTGIGVPAEERERMFEPFTQLDSSLARRFQGSGLGLHLARTLAVALGGTLMLEDPKGPGTVAVLRFPPARLLPAPAIAGPLPA